MKIFNRLDVTWYKKTFFHEILVRKLVSKKISKKKGKEKNK